MVLVCFSPGNGFCATARIFFSPRSVRKTAHLWLHFHRIRQIWLWFHGLLLIVSSEVMVLLTFGCVWGEFLELRAPWDSCSFSLRCGFRHRVCIQVHRTPVSAPMRLRARQSRWDKWELSDLLVSGRTCGKSSKGKIKNQKKYLKKSLCSFRTACGR